MKKFLFTATILFLALGAAASAQNDAGVVKRVRAAYAAAKEKISLFCDVDENAVISCPDARTIYEVPMILDRQGVADYIIKRMNR